MAKSKDSPEFFEVFRSALRDRDKAQLAAENLQAAAPPQPAVGAQPAYIRDVPQPRAFGERTLTLRYNAVVVLLILFVVTLFAAFAIGEKWGEERIAEQTIIQKPDVPGKSQQPPQNQGGGQPSQPVEPRQPANLPQPQKPPVQEPSEFWTVKLIEYENDNGGKSSAGIMVKWLEERSVKDAFQVAVTSPKNRIWVCASKCPARQEAEEKLPGLRALRSQFESSCSIEKISKPPNGATPR